MMDSDSKIGTVADLIADYPSRQRKVCLLYTSIRQMAKQILNDPAEVNIAISKPNEAIEQGAYICYEGQKLGMTIVSIIHNSRHLKTLIFTNYYYIIYLVKYL